MENIKYVVSDYDTSAGKLGVFYREERILFGWENDFGIRDYKFVFVIYVEVEGDRRIFRWNEPPKYHEIIEFHHVCDLKDYVKSYTLPEWMLDEGEDGTRYTLDETKLLLECVPEKFEYLKERLLRKFRGSIPEPVIYSADKWHNGDEFLTFTDESAYSWAGPFEQNGKLGACASIKSEQYDENYNLMDEGVINIPIIDASSQWSWYDLPPSIRKESDEFAKEMGVTNGDHMLYKGDKDYKKALFETFSVEEKHYIFKRILGRCDKEWIQSILPYMLYLCGTDDCSYTKWFATREEAESELQYLRMMQPLDMDRDIYKRDYVFTN